MPSEVEAFIESIREKYEAALEQASLYGRMLRELEAAVDSPSPARQASTRSRTTDAARPKTGARRKPVKSEVSAADAVLRLLAGCRMGLPSSEIVQHVAANYGHRPNSLRTTLYNLKKSGAIVQDEQRVYHHAENVG